MSDQPKRLCSQTWSWSLGSPGGGNRFYFLKIITHLSIFHREFGFLWPSLSNCILFTQKGTSITSSRSTKCLINNPGEIVLRDMAHSWRTCVLCCYLSMPVVAFNGMSWTTLGKSWPEHGKVSLSGSPESPCQLAQWLRDSSVLDVFEAAVLCSLNIKSLFLLSPEEEAKAQ